jgi:hypothetical protein
MVSGFDYGERVMMRIAVSVLAKLDWKAKPLSEPIASCIVSGHGQPFVEVDEKCLAGLGISLRRGPGSHLKTLLAALGFSSGPDCKCNQRAAYMDAKGCDWCESPEGIAEIMGFLRESAEERGLPFLDLPARLLVKRAIANARREEARHAEEETRPAV